MLHFQEVREREPQSELITAVEVSAANVGDGAVAMTLLEQQGKVGLAPAEVVAAQQYADGELREQGQAHDEGTTIVTKALGAPQQRLPAQEGVRDRLGGGHRHLPSGAGGTLPLPAWA
jgi:hypothetical protein